MGSKKKLYQFRPKDEEQPIEVHFTKHQKQVIKANSLTVENEVRQMLAEKISGTHVGLWLLLPEHLRLGTWDLLKAWSGRDDQRAVEPRLGLQIVHESALCVNGLRQRRTLRQKGFETLNGLPFVATDQQIHKLLNAHSVDEAESLQIALGQMRQALGHYPGESTLIDPHRIRSWTKRQMQHKKLRTSEKARKMLQTFFAINGKSSQPIVAGIGSSSVTVSQGTISILDKLACILPQKTLIVADTEHFTVDILDKLNTHPKFTFLIPAPRHAGISQYMTTMHFHPLWAGYAVAEGHYRLKGHDDSMRLIIQRTGETEDQYVYKPFVTNSNLKADQLMTLIFPERWNIEEFFNTESSLGWNRGSTLNLNIRLGKISLSLISQAALFQFRNNLPDKMKNWTAQSIGQKIFAGIDGDLRVKDDTIIITLYNAPNNSDFKKRYHNISEKLQREGINPHIPWLYNFKFEYRFK